MKNLFLIDGASGTGKSDLIKFVNDYNNNVSYIQKYTTRKSRQYERESDTKLDLLHISEEEFYNHNFDYFYRYGGNKYGFYEQSIKNEFKEVDNVFIIVRDVETIKNLKNSFNHINVVSIFIYTDRDMIVDRLKKDSHTKEDIQLRIERLEISYRSYLENPAFYDEVLINSGSEQDYHRIIKSVFNDYRDRSKIQQNHIFVIMSFNPKYENVLREFKDAARLVNADLVVTRVDETRGDYKITDEILKNIEKANLIICDLTDERPNVYYELGYARGLHKKVISCAKKGTKLHFDIHNFRTIFYGSLTELRKEISLEVKEHFNL